MDQDSWIAGFLTATFLFTGRYAKYDEARDEYLRERALSAYDSKAEIAANE